MAKSIRKTLLLAKIQTAEGVDPVPTGAANAILLRNVTATPLSAEFVERALLRPTWATRVKWRPPSTPRLKARSSWPGRVRLVRRRLGAAAARLWLRRDGHDRNGRALPAGVRKFRAHRAALLPGRCLPQDPGCARHGVFRPDRQGHPVHALSFYGRLSAHH